MKVIKETNHGLLINHFQVDNRSYLAVTIMTFFAFAAPDEALPEQELWPFVQQELGPDAVLDAAMPKPQGEVLIHGYAFAPQGKAVPALPVEFRVGPIAKTVYVFGDRYWQGRGNILSVISAPAPFTVMPLTYDRAFGGAGFDRNPLGKGYAPGRNERGEEIWPLPNLENPLCLIASPADRPEPVGVGPLDGTHPRRAKKLGTYDRRWFENRWPGYPEDMDWSYFNAAPEDQQQLDFFAGGEKILLKHLHKDKPLIESRLPELRQRCFVNVLADQNDPGGEKRFREVKTRLETVWLFPHAERGIALFRGAVEVADDEALDVRQLYLVTERKETPPQTLEQHHEEFKKRLNRKIPAEAAATAAQARAMAREKLAALAERLKDLPREIEDAVAQGLGMAPSPVRTTAELVAGAQANIDDKITLFDTAEERLKKTKAKFGHLVKIDLSGFARGRAQLTAAKAELAALPGMAAAVATDHEKALAGIRDKVQSLQGKIDPALLAKHNLDDPERYVEQYRMPAPDPWQEQGMRFLEKCRNNLEQYPQIMKMLTAMGLRPYTIKRFWIGVHPGMETYDPLAWGLPAENPEREHPRELTLPGGLVVPTFDKANIHRIRIRSLRRRTYPPPDFPTLTFTAGREITQDFLLEGSGEQAMILAAGKGKPFLRVAYEFEAILLNQEIGALCTVAALSDPEAKLEEEAAAWLKEAPQFLVLLYPEAEAAAERDIAPWRQRYPRAEPLTLPAGRNLYEAKKAGVDIRQWIVAALRPELAPAPEAKPREVDMDKPGALTALIPVIDVAALIKTVREGVAARVQPDLDRLEARKKEVLDKARERLAAKGMNLDELLQTPEKSLLDAANPFRAVQEKNAGQIAKIRQHLEKQGGLTPQLAEKITEAEKINTDVLARAAAQYEEGMARLKAAESQAAAGLPAWAQQLFARAGLDPDDPTLLRPLTKEEVVDRHSRGLSLAGKNLAGLDLSGLDLSGADLRKAKLMKTNLQGCRLDGADLTHVLAGEADFTTASLRGAQLSRGIFQKAKFTGADLAGGDLTKAVMTEADLSRADLRDARLNKTLLEKALLKGAKLNGATAGQAYFIAVDAAGASFAGTDLTKAIFQQATLDGADFSGATAAKVLFVASGGKKVNFSGADLFNVRILKGSAFPEGDFRQARAQKATWMNSDLTGGNFAGLDIKRGLIQECNLTGVNLAGAAAREARFTKSDLTDANCRGMKLFRGSLRKAKLVRTDLRDANLYGAEFFRTGVGETKFDGANLKMTKLHKRTDLLPERPDSKKPRP